MKNVRLHSKYMPVLFQAVTRYEVTIEQQEKVILAQKYAKLEHELELPGIILLPPIDERSKLPVEQSSRLRATKASKINQTQPLDINDKSTSLYFDSKKWIVC